MTITAAATLARADGLDLIGEMKGSGYRLPPALVRRADGQTVQLTPILYAVLEEVHDGRSAEDVAAGASERLGRTVTPENVNTLVDTQLRPLGLLKTADGANPELKRSNPLLGLRWRFAISDPRLTRRLTTPFAVMFNPVLVVAITAGFVAVAWWVLLHKGLASATYEAFQHPGLLMVLVGVMLLSAGFHEFGHAAAATRGGSLPGTIGGGIYLVWPAFYTDVTDAYRLGRLGRIRTDLGGLYFDAMVAVAIFGIWTATGWDGWLLVVAAQVLGMLRQLTPLVRFDGYHILCDVTGVPDLFSRIKPILLSFLPKYWKSPDVVALKWWVRAVTSLWVLVVVPTLLFSLFAMLWALPRVAGTAWAKVQQHWDTLLHAAGGGDYVEVGARTIALLATAFPVIAIALMLSRLSWGVGRRTWVGTRGAPVKRSLAAVVALLIVAMLAVIWWPRPDRYRPIQPWERGTLADVQPYGAGMIGSQAMMRVGYTGSSRLVWPEGQALPTREHPQLALVLVPSSGPATTTGSTGSSTDGSTAEHPWIFPFNRPLAPSEGDNQAMAVNYQDGGTTYDVAFAMVWAQDGQDVLNKNEAYALASCTRCTTVAVAFQVVLVVGQSDVVIPQNISAAVNYNCLSCVTVALAQQLAVTLGRVPSEETLELIRSIWAEAMEFSTHLEGLSFAEIAGALDDFEVRVLTALKEDGALVVPTAPSPSVTGSRDATPSTDPAGDGAAGPSGSPTGQPADDAGTSGGDETTTSGGGSTSTDGGASDQPSPAPGGTPTSTEAAAPEQTAPADPAPSP